MIPCDLREAARAGDRGRFALAGGPCRPRGLACLHPIRLFDRYRRAWDSTLWFLGWDRSRPDCNPGFLRMLRSWW